MLRPHGAIFSADSARADAPGVVDAARSRRRGRAARPRGLRGQEPGRAQRRRRWSRRAASAACRCSVSSSWPGGCCPTRFVAVTGTNGKTTTSELLGAIWRTADRPVAVAGNVGIAAGLARRLGGPGGHDRVRGLELSGRGLAGLRARHSAAPQPGGGPPRPARHARRLRGGQAARVRQPDRPAGGGGAGRLRVAGPGPARAVRRPRRAAARRGGDPAARPAQSRERDGRLGGRAGVGCARGRRGGCTARVSPAFHTGSRRSARWAECCTSTTRRPPTWPRPGALWSPSRPACTPFSAGARRGAASAACARRWPRAAVPVI